MRYDSDIFRSLWPILLLRIDFKAIRPDGRPVAVEVKGYTRRTWKQYLGPNNPAGQKKINALIKQLENGQKLGSPPILVVSDAIDSATLRILTERLKNKIPGIETKLAKVSKRLRDAMKVKTK